MPKVILPMQNEGTKGKRKLLLDCIFRSLSVFYLLDEDFSVCSVFSVANGCKN